MRQKYPHAIIRKIPTYRYLSGASNQQNTFRDKNHFLFLPSRSCSLMNRVTTAIVRQVYHEFRNRTGGDAENVNDDIFIEIELIKQVEINIDLF